MLYPCLRSFFSRVFTILTICRLLLDLFFAPMRPENSILIQLDSSHGFFVAGSVVSGRVVLDVVDSINSRYITLQAYGHGKICFYRHSRNTSGNLQNQRYSDKKTFFEYNIPLWKTKDGSGIPPGLHSYPFSIQLPLDCPPNFEGKYGHIRYNIKAEVQQAWAFNLKAEQRFNVTRGMNPSPPMYWEPVIVPFSKVHTFSGEVTGEIHMPKRVLSMGEQIPIQIVVNNLSGDAIDSIEVGIQTEACYTYTSNFMIFKNHLVQKETILSSIVKSDNLWYVEGSQNVYNCMLTLDKSFPTINDFQMISVNNFLYIKIRKDAFFSRPAVQTIPIFIIATPGQVLSDHSRNNSIISNFGSTNLNTSTQDLRRDNNILYPSLGFQTSSVPEHLNNIGDDAYGSPPPAYSQIYHRNDFPSFQQQPSDPPPKYKNY